MKTIGLVFFLLVTGFAVQADTGYRHAVGLDYGLGNISAKTDDIYPLEKSIGFRLSTFMIKRWRLELDAVYEKIYADSTANSSLTIGSKPENRYIKWRAISAHLLCKYRFMPLESRFSFDAGLGAGITDWKMYDPRVDTMLNGVNERDEIVDLGTTEVALSMAIGLEYRISRILKIDIDGQINFLTGWGQEFDPAIEKNLTNRHNRISISISYLFGENKARSYQPAAPPQLSRMYLESMAGDLPVHQQLSVYSRGPDDDGDGIPDIIDQCPNTPAAAAGRVDIKGCPVDTDCDGYPDYLDNCPSNLIGARVADNGCPYDSDGDGVPDGLDDCPDSDPTLAVDASGCVDIEALKIPMLLHIKYESGSFEIDYKHMKILEDLSRLLVRAKTIKVEINGYTDNIGTAEANKSLSQKRANRVRDYLISLGIEPERLSANGRGETNFIASNEIREGRDKNRRVELIFYR